MAIDSSIWLYQFQATMRDKDGRVLVNAHVLGESRLSRPRTQTLTIKGFSGVSTSYCSMGSSLSSYSMEARRS